jgi:hypothetical protein
MLCCLWGSLSGKFFTKTAVEGEALLVGLYSIPSLCCIVDNSFLVQLSLVDEAVFAQIPVFRFSAHCNSVVAGVLQVDFIEPAHDKQDFERTALFIKLETRLKQITMEYWYVSVVVLIGNVISEGIDSAPSLFVNTKFFYGHNHVTRFTLQAPPLPSPWL